MALFFKRIRQKLLLSRRFGKYTLYALGEVLIVIVGILVAVQVNNKNKEREDRVIELSILKTIKADLERDLKTIDWDIGAHKWVRNSSRIIQQHLENDLPYNDTLTNHFMDAFMVTHWFYNSGGIQSLKSLGVNTVTNEKVRSQIIELYDYRYDYMRYLTTGMNNAYEFGAENILLSRFDQAQFWDDYETEELWDGGGMTPLDYEGLKTDDEYQFHLKSFYNLTGYYLMECDSTRNMISRAIKDLGEEIKALEN